MASWIHQAHTSTATLWPAMAHRRNQARVRVSANGPVRGANRCGMDDGPVPVRTCGIHRDGRDGFPLGQAGLSNFLAARPAGSGLWLVAASEWLAESLFISGSMASAISGADRRRQSRAC